MEVRRTIAVTVLPSEGEVVERRPCDDQTNGGHRPALQTMMTTAKTERTALKSPTSAATGQNFLAVEPLQLTSKIPTVARSVIGRLVDTG